MERLGLRKVSEHAPHTFQSDIFTKEIEWTVPVGTKQTYKVWQRNDIDWSMVRTNPEGNKRFIGRTNAEAAKAGIAPELPNGYFATLHHIGQDSRGALVEASRHLHDFSGITLPNGKKSFDILHSVYGHRQPHPIFPVDHNVFKLDFAAYWKWRVQ